MYIYIHIILIRFIKKSSDWLSGVSLCTVGRTTEAEETDQLAYLRLQKKVRRP